ncbi:hydroxymethylglutaryl-CoA reductase, degradative [Lacticaseibacillus nasuensis]|uniref:hydroxymethylglutaryl-CoA reductase, degradative n=1 Tax=Lacticaseibacillus nasuensis TaxID=944671 RepID=UPI0022453EC6|nr:hydroxymethylglutaryl-CoA reductase, degradative [Lacticaseibacillus nasuensis]MCX2456103.1 hydroxymethylglutaryl-CoA reductase, degradative [Lacticaseibacillus nasuensis]
MKFYQMTPAARRAALVAEGALTPAAADQLATSGALPAAVADALSENQIGQFTLPFGVCRNLVINGQLTQVPMVTEEPSVVAAASNGARMVRASGGVHVTTAPHLVTGEIVFDHLTDLPAAVQLVSDRQAELTAVAAAAHPSLVDRGGGLRGVTPSIVAARWLKLQVTIDPQAAMGANLVNTLLEAMAAVVGEWLHAEPLVAILSNQVPEQTVATVTLAPAALATRDHSGQAIAERVVALSELAQVDSDRAVTHNKGIMNGVNAVVLASGNDTRAVAAAVFASATSATGMQPLSRWWLAADQLHGELRLPLPVGVVGGAISALPLAQVASTLGQWHTVAQLQAAIAAVGLVQNLAALRALVGPGIQAGHMALQAHALAIAAGATGSEIQALVARLHTKDLAAARRELAALRKEGQHDNHRH